MNKLKILFLHLLLLVSFSAPAQESDIKSSYAWWTNDVAAEEPEGDPVTVVITSNASNPEAGTFTTTFTFSEAVENFTLSDTDVDGGIQNTLQTANNIVYTCTVTPIFGSDITISVPAAGCRSVATHVENSAATPLSVTVFDPTDLAALTFGLETDGAKKLNFTTDPRTVKSVTDISGDGIDPTAPGADYQNQPFYYKTGKYIGMNGEAKRLELTDDMAAYNSDQQGELVFLYQKVATNSGAYLLMTGQTSADNWFSILHAAGNAAVQPNNLQVRRTQGGNIAVGVNLPDLNWHLGSVRSDGSAWKIYLANGSGVPVEQSLTTTGSNAGHWFADLTTPTTSQIGSLRTSTTGRSANINLSCEFLFNAVLSDANRALLFKYIKTKYQDAFTFGTSEFNLALASDPHTGADKANGRNAITDGLTAIATNLPANNLTGILGDFFRNQGPVELSVPSDVNDGVENAAQLNSNSTILRSHIFECIGNHDYGAGNSNVYDRYIDIRGVNHTYSGNSFLNFPYAKTPFVGSSPYSYRIDIADNTCFVVMSDRNDYPYPVGFLNTLEAGGLPSGAIAKSHWEAIKAYMVAHPEKQYIFFSHHGPRNTTIWTPDNDGVDSGTHGSNGIAAGSGSYYTIRDEDLSSNENGTSQFLDWFRDNPDHHVIAWFFGHGHYAPGANYKTKENVFVQHGVFFQNIANWTQYHSGSASQIKVFDIQFSGRLMRSKMWSIINSPGYVAGEEYIVPMKMPIKITN